MTVIATRILVAACTAIAPNSVWSWTLRRPPLRSKTSTKVQVRRLSISNPRTRRWRSSSSSSDEERERDNSDNRMPKSSYWHACPNCHGEGKIRKTPSRKARLRHQKRIKTEEGIGTKKLPVRLDPCPECQQTGLIPSTTPPLPNPNYPHVAIVGGGLGGLALGLACWHRGIPYTIFERDCHFAQRSQGYGLTMQQASRALAAFGISSLGEAGITSTKHIVHTSDGTVVGEWGLRKWGRAATKAPPKRQNVHIARQALRRILLDAFDSEQQQRICWGYKLVHLKQHENETEDGEGDVTLEFEVTDKTNEQNYRAFSMPNMVVVGADGIRSQIREQWMTNNHCKSLRYLGCLVVLGICSLEALQSSSRSNELLDGETVFQTADGTTRIYLMPFSSTEYMWQLSFPMSDETVAKELSRRGPAALKAEALKRCGLWHSPIPDILEMTPIDLVSGYPVYDRDLLTIEALDDSAITNFPNVSLVGDAAHPMSPFKGQGANQALLDALSLVRALYGTSCRREELVCKALTNYHDEMTVRSAAKVTASAKAAEFLHTDAAIQLGNVTRGAAAAAELSTE